MTSNKIEEFIPVKLTLKLVHNRLELGDLLSYKDLCIRLSQPQYGGTQKTAQLKEFARYFKSVKEKSKYLIIDIYDEVQEPEIRKLRKDAVFTKYIEYILLTYLSKQENNKVTKTLRQWWEVIGMINKSFHEVQTEDEFTLKYLEDMNRLETGRNLTTWDINHFYQRCRSKLYNIFKDALENLKKRNLILYNENMYILIDKNSGDQIEATRQEITDYILPAGRYALDCLDLETTTQVFLKNKYKEYHKHQNEYLQKHSKYKSVYKVYEIIYNQDSIIRKLPSDKVVLEKIMLDFNKSIKKSIDNNARYIYDKNQRIVDDAIEEWYNSPAAEGEDSKTIKVLKKNEYMLNDTYLETQYMLSDELIQLPIKESGALPEIDIDDILSS